MSNGFEEFSIRDSGCDEERCMMATKSRMLKSQLVKKHGVQISSLRLDKFDHANI